MSAKMAENMAPQGLFAERSRKSAPRGGLAVPRARVTASSPAGARGKIAGAGCFLWGESGGKEGARSSCGGA